MDFSFYFLKDIRPLLEDVPDFLEIFIGWIRRIDLDDLDFFQIAASCRESLLDGLFFGGFYFSLGAIM